jgi:hypothetical protein
MVTGTGGLFLMAEMSDSNDCRAVLAFFTVEAGEVGRVKGVDNGAI